MALARLTIAAALIVVLPLAPALAPTTEACEGLTLIPYLGPACRVPGTGTFAMVEAPNLQTHGLDAEPQTPVCLVDLNGDLWPEAVSGGGDGIPGAGACPPERAPPCAGEGGQRVELVYMVASDRPDRYSEAQVLLPKALAFVNGAIWREAHEFGYDADLRVVCVDGQPKVAHLRLAETNGQALAIGLVPLARSHGYTDDRVKYVLAYENSIRAFAQSSGDDRPGPDNGHNTTVGYAVVPYGPQWDLILHELGHTLGAVQTSAPHSSHASGHCLDGQDYMCYEDRDTEPPGLTAISPSEIRGFVVERATRPPYLLVCVDREYFDCGHDDYFHPEPAAGSYLATHWNVASPNNGFVWARPAP